MILTSNGMIENVVKLVDPSTHLPPQAPYYFLISLQI